MAASTGFGNGYSCELFFSPVPDELKCGLCKQVARCPNISSCCGEHFCEACIDLLITEKEDCPSCGLDEFTYFADKRVQRKTLALDVRCAMKDRGCEWTGKLENLDSHMEMSTGDCQYMDAPCPKNCGVQVQKRELATHLSSHCTKREFICKYCNFRATYEVIVNHHKPQCPRYPIPCPNGCRVVAVERCTLEDHLNSCPLQEVSCEFSYAGCNVILVREEMEKHLEEGTQRHMLLMNRALYGRLQEREENMRQLEEKFIGQQHWVKEELEKGRVMQEQLEMTANQLKDELQRKDEELKRVTEKVEKLEEELGRKDVQIKQLENKFGVQIAVPNFTALLTSRRCWISTPRCVYPGRFRIYIKVWPNGWLEGAGSHVSVWLSIMKGDNDGDTEAIADCTVTIQLLNQHRDQDHVTVKRRFQWNRQCDPVFTGTISNTFLPHTELDWNITQQTQYLRNDCLQFKVTEFDVYNF